MYKLLWWASVYSLFCVYTGERTVSDAKRLKFSGFQRTPSRRIRPNASKLALAGDVLGHPELVSRPDTSVADGIHHLPHQEHSLPAHRALVKARRDVRCWQGQWIELRAVVLQRHREGAVGQDQ